MVPNSCSHGPARLRLPPDFSSEENALRIKALTFGDLIASLYQACDQRRVIGFLKLSVGGGLVVLPRPLRMAIHGANA
jgi:hypothetical protein